MTYILQLYHCIDTMCCIVASMYSVKATILMAHTAFWWRNITKETSEPSLKLNSVFSALCILNDWADLLNKD